MVPDGRPQDGSTDSLPAQASLFDELPASFFRTVIETANEGIWMINAEGQTTFANDRMLQMLGVDAAQLVGRHPAEFLVIDDLNMAATIIRDTLGGLKCEFEPRFQRPDGSLIHTLGGTAAIRDDNGRIIGAVATFSDVTARTVAEQALVDSEQQAKNSAALLNQLLEAATDAIWMRDSHGVFRVANTAACRVIGDDHDKIIGKAMADIWGPEVGAHLASESAALFASRQALLVEEQMFDASRGVIRTFFSNKVPLFSDDGRPFGILGISRDITDRKRDEERERLLAREVDHRAKNLLAVVQSVVQLTQAGDADELKVGIIGRIQALARAHNLLADARWDGAQLGDLVREELAPYLDGSSGRASVSGPAVLLRPAAAQSLAMVLHELATNAVKYGALASPSGMLEVEWTRTPEWLELSWGERGGPAIKRPGKNGFGTKIIRASVERQLHGTLDQVWRPEGLSCTIRIKASDAIGAADQA
jgi:PAS domain S-box-containing protein